MQSCIGINSAELSHSLKVLDRGGDTPKPVRSESVCAGLWAPPQAFCLASSGFGADLGPKLTNFGRILKSFPGPFSSTELIGSTTGRGPTENWLNSCWQLIKVDLDSPYIGSGASYRSQFELMYQVELINVYPLLYRFFDAPAGEIQTSLPCVTR